MVRAYDPTDKVSRPHNSYHPNIHFYNIGIGPANGNVEFGGENKYIPVKTLQSLLRENGDYGKRITYLKIDIEGTEISGRWNEKGLYLAYSLMTST